MKKGLNVRPFILIYNYVILNLFQDPTRRLYMKYTLLVGCRNKFGMTLFLFLVQC